MSFDMAFFIIRQALWRYFICSWLATSGREEVYYIVSAFSFVCKISFFRGMIYFFKNGFDFLFRYGKKGVP